MARLFANISWKKFGSHTLKVSSEEVMVIRSEKMKAKYVKEHVWKSFVVNFPTGTPRRIHVDSTWILHRYVEDQISTNFHVISIPFVDIILQTEKFTLFPNTFFDVISMIEKSMLFLRIFFDVILMVEKSTLFSRTFFDVISMVKKPT